MLISVNDLKKIYSDYDFSNVDDKRLERRLQSIEHAIIEYTHNHFYNLKCKTKCFYGVNYLQGDFRKFNIGDTIEIYDSKENDGLYVIVEKPNDLEISLDKDVYQEDGVMKIIKIEYPYDVIDGCVELLDYEFNQKDKSKNGIASETISRHSVSYVQRNDSNSLLGYPKELLGFLKPYVRWRT
jgi:hypothetical protein